MADEGREEQQQGGDGGAPGGGGGYSGGNENATSGGAIITYSQPYDLNANRTGDVGYLGGISDDVNPSDGYYLLEFSKNGDFSSPSYSAYAGTGVGFDPNNPPSSDGGGSGGSMNGFEITDGSNIYDSNGVPLETVRFNEIGYGRVKRKSNTSNRYDSPGSTSAEFYIVPIIYVNGGGQGRVFPFWDNQYTITGNDSFNSLFRLRKDLRDGMLDVISSKVRELGQHHLNSTFNFYEGEPSNEDIINAGNPSLFASSERTRLIDGMITEVMYNTEQMLNVFGDPFVQSMYNQMYARLTDLRTYLNDLITETVSATHLNLIRSQELVNMLQRKVNEENIYEHTISVNSIDIVNKMEAILFRANSRTIYDILPLVTFVEDEPIVSFSSLTALIGASNKSNYFQPGYIKISPKPIENISISSHQNSLISFTQSLNLDDEDMLGGFLVDNNNKTYKIVNKINSELGLLDRIPTNNSNITKFIPNYFEQQIIQLNFSGQHNYVPKLLPIGFELPALLPEPLPIIAEPVVTQPQIIEETKEGIIPEVNKEIG